MLAFLDRQLDDFAADFRADVNLHDRLNFSVGDDRFRDGVARNFFRLDGEPPARAEVGPAMFGRDILVEALEREGVEVIFAYPGGASMEIHQSLTKSKIRTILPRHEQGGSFAAEGYARATGKAGVCMGTSGPGATNLVTAIADAYMDSCPLIAITGQVNQAMIGRGAFQETDIIGVTLPIVKHTYLITDINDIPRIVKEAFYIAQTGRPGPVVIDLPKNIQQAKTQPVWPTLEQIKKVCAATRNPICAPTNSR